VDLEVFHHKQLTLATPAGTTFDNAAQEVLCEWRCPSKAPHPLVVHLSSDAPQSLVGASLNLSRAMRWFVGAKNGGGAIAVSPDNAGFVGLVLEYGAASAVRRVVMDWKPGSYQLPPCTYARASLLSYRTVGGAFITGGKLSVALAVGRTTNPARPEVTFGSSIIGTAAGGIATNWTAVLPSQVRWADLWADLGDPNTIDPGDSTAPQLVLRSTGARGCGIATLERDYVNKAGWPNWGPVEIGGIDSVSVNVACLNTSTPEIHAWLRFWLEL
jgi:hypothetical protein